MTHQGHPSHDSGGVGRTRLSMISRRSFIAGIALGLAAAPLTAGAQQGKTWRVGFLSGGARTPGGLPPLALREAFRELGYVEQQNVVYLGGGPRPNRISFPDSLPSSSDSRLTSS